MTLPAAWQLHMHDACIAKRLLNLMFDSYISEALLAQLVVVTEMYIETVVCHRMTLPHSASQKQIEKSNAKTVTMKMESTIVDAASNTRCMLKGLSLLQDAQSVDSAMLSCNGSVFRIMRNLQNMQGDYHA